MVAIEPIDRASAGTCARHSIPHPRAGLLVWERATGRLLDAFRRLYTRAGAEQRREASDAAWSAPWRHHAEPPAELHRTLDGSALDEDSPRWTGPLLIERATVLRVKAYRPGCSGSLPVVAEFTVR